jgi:RNA polymerase sigma factor (sigma-70 family)
MSTKSTVLGLQWDFSQVELADASQRWVLSAMQKQGPALLSMLWRILGSESDVCDVYQQTFLQLAHYQGRQKPKNIKAYLFRTAANIAVSTLRRKEINKRHTAKLAEARSEIVADNATADLDAKELSEKLRDAISSLPDYLREVIVLRDLGELPYEQVAKMLNISSSTARVYRCKAVSLLAKWMSDYGK